VEPLRETNGRVSGVIGVAFDVTDRHRAEDALRESEARLRTIIAIEPECVKLVDQQGPAAGDEIPAASPWSKRTASDMVRGQPILRVVAPEHHAAYMDLHRRVLDGESGTAPNSRSSD